MVIAGVGFGVLALAGLTFYNVTQNLCLNLSGIAGGPQDPNACAAQDAAFNRFEWTVALPVALLAGVAAAFAAYHGIMRRAIDS
jgi:hypothetical protein